MEIHAVRVTLSTVRQGPRAGVTESKVPHGAQRTTGAEKHLTGVRRVLQGTGSVQICTGFTEKLQTRGFLLWGVSLKESEAMVEAGRSLLPSLLLVGILAVKQEHGGGAAPPCLPASLTSLHIATGACTPVPWVPGTEAESLRSKPGPGRTEGHRGSCGGSGRSRCGQ